MVDDEFGDPRLAAIYDALDPDRSDLAVYVDLAGELGARTVLDLGCGTGTFALLLADRGVDVIGVDPAAASIEVARAKPGADRVRWIVGDGSTLPPVTVDLVTMTGNAAQGIDEPADWSAALAGCHDVLAAHGHLVFETRVPARRAWAQWNPESSYSVTAIPEVGRVESWTQVLEVDGPLVHFRTTWVFGADGTVLTSDSTLRFRELGEIEAELAAHGFRVRQVRDAPDRPGREFVVIARPAGCASAAR